MKITSKNNNVIIHNVNDFDLSQTLECGQCFRFYKLAEQSYVVVASHRAVKIEQKDQDLIFYDSNLEDVTNFWINYFDLDRDYAAIKTYLLKKDARLEDAIKEKSGVRIINQEFHEMVISFIISQNKQIPHIKQLVERISNTYGELICNIDGVDYYSFPSVDVLASISEDEWREMRVGFRAPYLYDASQKLANGEIAKKDFVSNNGLIPEDEAIDKLTSIKGVGEKVANCVMLFSLGYRNAFPVDVWIKRIMEYCYFDSKETDKKTIKKFAEDLYGEYGGYAQQYLFCYGRDNNLGK